MTQSETSDSREANPEEVAHMREMFKILPPGTREATKRAARAGAYTKEGCAVCSAIRKALDVE